MNDCQPNFIISFFTFVGYAVLYVWGSIRDSFGKVFKSSNYQVEPGYAPLVADFDEFYQRRFYRRIQDCFNIPICSSPGARIDIMERVSHDRNKTLELTGNKIEQCLNLGSYNYLGFGDPNSPCKPLVLDTLDLMGVSTCSFRSCIGVTKVQKELEELTARYIGKEASMCFSMGFGTNGTGIPSLIGKGSLIISDANNHSSIITGARISGATIRVFKHSDIKDLEKTIRQSIVEGQPKTHRPWKKILIMVEGVYSMEGEACPLKQVVEIKKKYNCYLFVDEAHSVGALGTHGKGICDYAGVDPADVDILMGTYTKSFGAVGGYIASSHELINHIKLHSAGTIYSAGMSAPAARQCIEALKIILGEDGTNLGQEKIKQLRENSDYFRREMNKLGCHVLGDFGTPVVPIMLYNLAKIVAFSRECFKEKLAVVVVGFPATPLLLSRVRFCISAAHTKEDLKDAVQKLAKVIDRTQVRYGRRLLG